MKNRDVSFLRPLWGLGVSSRESGRGRELEIHLYNLGMSSKKGEPDITPHKPTVRKKSPGRDDEKATGPSGNRDHPL